MSADSPTAGEKLDRLIEIMALLRSPGGCPWDREQDFDTIKPYLLEETYEVMDAIDAHDWSGLADELGDLLLQPVFFAQMASEAGLFNIADSLDAINAKLVRRHPHVFGDVTAETAGDVKRNWDLIKAEEKKDAGESPAGLLQSISRATPALVEAQGLGGKASSNGFDWDNPDQVLEKLNEELGELAEARASGNQEELAGEIGDILFVVVNIARHLKVDAEQALRKSNAKFRARFGYIERTLAAQARTPRQASLEEMESLWREAKNGERAG